MPRPSLHPLLSVLAAGASLALTGCFPVPDESPGERPTTVDPDEVDTGDLRQGEIPDAEAELDETELPLDEPDPGAPAEERFAWLALLAIAEFAGSADPDAEVVCPEVTDLGSGSVTADCVVTYGGENFEASPGERPDGSILSQVIEGPVLRDVVEDELRRQENTEYVRCGMPQAVTVYPMSLVDDKLIHLCEYLDPNSGDREEIRAEISHTGNVLFRSS